MLLLSFDGEDTLQCCGGHPQSLSHGNGIVHGLSNVMAAHHQHMGASQQVTANVDWIGYTRVDKKKKEMVK